MKTIPMTTSRLPGSVWPLLLALFLAGCQGTAGDESTPGKASPSGAGAEVKTVKPVRKTLRHHIKQPGEIQAFERAPLYARVSGYVAKVYKDIGDPVEEGELLVELSIPEMDAELEQKQALAAQAQSEVEQAKKLLAAAAADLKSAGARVKEARAGTLRAAAELRRAESQFGRLQKTSGVIAQEALDESRLGVEAAKATVAEVEAKVWSAEADSVSKEARRDKARADVTVAKAKVRVAAADMRRVAALLGYAKLRAPFAGVVTWRDVDPGHLLQPGGGSGRVGPVFVVSRTDPVRVFVDVPEQDAVLVADRTPAVVSIQALKGEEFLGKVKRSAWALETKGGRTLRTEIDLKNPGGRLRPGMYAVAVLTVAHKDALALPAAAVVTKGEQSFCFLVRGGKAIRTPVVVGFRDGDFVEVLKKRLPGGPEDWVDFTGSEEVITGNPSALTDGQAVRASPG